MESIAELRLICQSSRPAIFRDFLSAFYYRLAIYFTWVCLRVHMTANQVTILSGLVACAGGVLLVSDDPWIVLIGVLCFHLFAILDMTDGEVARYSGQGGSTGHFLDWIMHFVSSSALMLGLLFSSMPALAGPFMLIGVIALLIPLLDKSITASTWTVIAWTRLRDIQKGQSSFVSEGEEADLRNTRVYQWWRRRLVFLTLAPLQDHWVPMVLLILAIAEIAATWFGWSFFDYRLFLLIYIGVIGTPYLAFRVRRILITPALAEGYRRLFCPSRPISLPEDDFLG